MDRHDNAPKINLNYSGKFFRDENFECKRVAGVFSPVFVQTDTDFCLKSTSYQVLRKDKSPAFCVDGDKCVEKKLYLSSQNYIVVEKGIAGFEFNEKVFEVTVSRDGEDFNIDITESLDAELNEELLTIVCTEKRSSVQDFFRVGMKNMLLPQKEYMSKGLQDYKELIEKRLLKLKNTRFLDIDPTDETHKYLYIDDDEVTQYNKISGDYFTMLEFCVDRSRFSVQMPGGGFSKISPKYFKDRELNGIGILKMAEFRNQDEYAILEPVELLHDLDAHLWLKAKVKYRYPQDADQIADEYPKLIREATKKEEYWREVDPMDEIPKPYTLGDKEMYVPCEKKRNWWSIKNSPFQFCDDPGATGRFGRKREFHHAQGEYGVFFVNFEGEEYFARYKLEGRKRFCRDVYNHYTFYDFVSLSDVLANPDKDFGTYVLLCTYQFEATCNGITSISIDKETFDILDMAKREEPKEQNLCKLKQ